MYKLKIKIKKKLYKKVCTNKSMYELILPCKKKNHFFTYDYINILYENTQLPNIF